MKRLRRIFMNLAKINVPSFKENRITPPIIKAAFSNGFRVAMDDSNNIIAIRRNNWSSTERLPLLCAHMDNITFTPSVTNRKVFFNHKTGVISTEPDQVLGGDDKCGMAIILRLMELAPRCKYEFISVFTRGEERCQGANKLNRSIIDSASYALVLDRRNSSDVVTSINGQSLCGSEFADWVCVLAPGNISPVQIDSCFSDALALAEFGLDAVNLSCGYYGPHSTAETVNLNEMHDTMMWVGRILMDGMKYQRQYW